MKSRLHLYETRLISGEAKQPLSANVVRVRVWRSGYHDKEQNRFVHSNVFKSFLSGYLGHEPNIGHVSLELTNTYVSLWPDNLTITNKKKPQDGSLDSSVIIDERSEGRPPDLVIDFETLDTSQIIKDVHSFKNAGSKYHLFGGSRFFKHSEAHNCSGLAHKLLFNAGLKNFSIPKNYVRDYMLVTPNNLISYLESAKKFEEEVYMRNQHESSNIRSKH